MKKNNTMKNLQKKLSEDFKDFERLFNENCPNTQYIPVIHKKSPNTIIVFGDIHGDKKYAKDCLISSGVAKLENNKLIWCGNTTIVVQVGDQIDRCRIRRENGEMLTCDNPKTMGNNDEGSDKEILELFTEMHNQAQKVGGAVYSLLGNHELMNVQGNLSYVSIKGIEEFVDVSDKNTNKETIYAQGKINRAKDFAPGGKYGKFLGCNRLPCIIIGSYIFVHAGIVNGLINEIGLDLHNSENSIENNKENFELISKAIRLWLFGLLDTSYIKNIIDSTPNSIFWTRLIGSIPEGVKKDEPRCAEHLSDILKLFNLDRIIIGHTPKLHSGISGTCTDEKNIPVVIDVDTAASRAFDNVVNRKRLIQWLKIKDDKILKCSSDGCTELVY